MSARRWTKDDIARIIIAGGQAAGITPRGIVIGLSVGLVESNLTVYANAKVPGSLDLPHDAVGSDGMSVGVQQQQVVMSSMGWWWGPVETCQDPVSSTRLFFDRLARLDYNNTSRSPGSYAQQVQQSAYPDRYDQRMGEAQALYDRLTKGAENMPENIPSATYYDTDRSQEFAFGGPRNTANIVGICIHDTEGVTSAQADSETDDNVTTYQCTSRTGSYHVMVGIDGERIRQNTDDWATWSTGNKGNDILLHLCFVGSASQTRAEWLAQDKMLRAGATVVRYWADKYNIPLRRVDAAHLPGILGHGDTRVWGGTDHTDPGSNFPYDVLIQYAIELATGTTPVNPPETTPVNGGPLMALTDAEQHELLDGVRWIKQQLGPNVWGPDSSLGKNAAGEELTLRDGLAAHIRKADGR